MKGFVSSLLPILAVTLAQSGYAAQEHDHGHDHDHGAPMEQALHLNNGSKWQTDESLRHGMHSIRSLVEPHRQHQGSPEELQALAGEIKTRVERIVQTCKLDPEADAVLHVVLSDMFAGIGMLEGHEGESARGQGVERVLHTLENYGRFFNHPGWESSHRH